MAEFDIRKFKCGIVFIGVPASGQNGPAKPRSAAL